MTAYNLWNRCFTRRKLKRLFHSKIKYRSSVGLDWVSTEKFEKELDQNIDLILRKCGDSTYKFTRYRELLLSKGADKPPRRISIPTVRDKLVLSALNEILAGVYGTEIAAPMPQVIIKEIVDQIQTNKFDAFIKLDIKTFYPSIDQKLLMKTLRRKMRKKEICSLIQKSIGTNTNQPNSTALSPGETKGVPEGLSISNALANIYMSAIDKKHLKERKSYLYWRYVDDILIITSKGDVESVKKAIVRDIESLNLEINTNKTKDGVIADGFEYLGYAISNKGVSVRRNSVVNLERSLETIFRSYASSDDKNIEQLKWRVNLKITGFIIGKRKYGWLFFYSQISDLSTLARLDWLIKALCSRFDIPEDIHFKKFMKTYHEITKALHTTRYIPNLDGFSIRDKRRIVQQIYGKDMTGRSNSFVEMRFQQLINREIRDTQRDVQPFS